MSNFSDYALQLLGGGLPAVIDYGTGVPANAQGDTGATSARSASPQGRGEKRAPTGTFRDQVPGLNSGSHGLSTGAMIGTGVGVVVVLILIVVVLKR